MRTLAVAVAVVACLLLAGSAQASGNSAPAYPNQRAANVPEFVGMLAAGAGYWARRGVAITGPVELLVASDVGRAEDDLAYSAHRGPVRGRAFNPGWYGVSRIVLVDDWVGATLARIHSRRRTVLERRLHAANACALLWHELGHVGGIAMPRLVDGRYVDGHPDHGLMSAALTVPDDCRSLARTMVPADPAADRRARAHDGAERRSCRPGWTQATRGIDRLWDRGRKAKARRVYRRWKRTHARRAHRLAGSRACSMDS